MYMGGNFKVFITRPYATDSCSHNGSGARFIFCMHRPNKMDIRTALNKTAAAAKNNIHLFNLTCPLWKQAALLQPKCALEQRQLAQPPTASKVNYQDTGIVISLELRSSEVVRGKTRSQRKPTQDSCIIGIQYFTIFFKN